MGGQGKTQTALRYCRKAFQNRTFNTVLWIDASSEISAHQAINSILSKAGIPTSALEFERSLFTFKDALTSLTGPCLLVFDNYDTPREFSKIADMFVQHEQICIMLTSRHHESLRLGTPIHVREMDQSDAEDLLLISSGLIRQIRQEVNPKHLANIVNMLGRLPLALDQAGAYIRKLHLSLDVFEKHYMDKQKQILQYTPDLFEYRRSLLPGSEPSILSVFTTWELSLEQLGDDRPHLEHLLTLSAFFDHKKVHEALFSTRCTLNFTACSGVQDGWLQCMLTDSVWDSYRFQDIIANMYGLSLLQKFWMEDGHIVFSLHPLVNDWLRTRIGGKYRASVIVEAAVTAAGMDDIPNLLFHVRRCHQDLVDCTRTLFKVDIHMNSPRIFIANGTPIANCIDEELQPEPHDRQAKALCCPHGRPPPIIPSTSTLRLIVSCRLADITFPMELAQSQRSKLFDDLSESLSISMIYRSLQVLINIFGPIFFDNNPLSQRFRRLIIEDFDLFPETETWFSQSNTPSQAIVTLCQKIGEMSETDIEYKDAEVKVKQDEGKGIDGSFHTNLKEALADLTRLLELITPLDRPDTLVAIRNELRLLPFLQSGYGTRRHELLGPNS